MAVIVIVIVTSINAGYATVGLLAETSVNAMVTTF